MMKLVELKQFLHSHWDMCFAWIRSSAVGARRVPVLQIKTPRFPRINCLSRSYLIYGRLQLGTQVCLSNVVPSQLSFHLVQLVKVVKLLQKYITATLNEVTYLVSEENRDLDTQFALNCPHSRGSYITHLQWPVGGKRLRGRLDCINCLLCLKRQ